MTTRLGMFAKHWTPGRVKTRLAEFIGEQPAAMLHRQFVITLIARLADAADQRWLFFSPPEQQAAFESLTSNWRFHPQCDGDLGRRMDHYFLRSFRDGAQRVVLIGSDSPNLPRELIDSAFQLLETNQVVLGPSRDGGYYLIAARDESPPVFDDMPWGESTVLAATTQKLVDQGATFSLLPGWYDVDYVEDLRRLSRDLSEANGGDAALSGLHQWIANSLNLGVDE